MIISPQNYYGIPKSAIPMLETVAQDTFTCFFNLCREILQRISRKGITFFGDLDYSLKCHRIPYGLRLVHKNQSCSYWSIIEIRHEFADTNIVDLLVYSEDGKRLTLKDLEGRALLGKASLYWSARRLNQGDAWYAPVTRLDFKHPLLLDLQNALEELKRS